MKKLLITIIFPVMLFVTGCSLLPKPHRIDIQQGNIISQDDVNQLKVGMSKKQVLFVMGTPVIQDPFHRSRWDYYYSLERGRVPEPTNHVSLAFLGDQLITINGDMQPIPQTGAEDKSKRSNVITIVPKDEKVGISALIDSMINSVKSDDNKSAAKPKTLSKPQAPSAPGQKKEKSGGFFDSFINFFKGDSSDKREVTISPTEPTSEQSPNNLEQSVPGLNLDSFIHSGSGEKDREMEPAAIPDEPTAEAVPTQQEDSVTTLDSPDTPSEERPAKQGQSWTGMNLDSFIKPYSDSNEAVEQLGSGSTEQ